MVDFIITQTKGTCCLTSSTLTLTIGSFGCLFPPPGSGVYTLTQTSADVWTGSGNSPCTIDGTVEFTFTCSGGSFGTLDILCVGGTYDGATDSASNSIDCTSQTWSQTIAGSTAQCVDLGTTWFNINS